MSVRSEPLRGNEPRPGAPRVEADDSVAGILGRGLGVQQTLDALAAAGWRIVADQPEHLVELREDGWTLQHSMDCRLTGALFDCAINRALELRLHDASTDIRGTFPIWLHDGQLTLGDAHE